MNILNNLSSYQTINAGRIQVFEIAIQINKVYPDLLRVLAFLLLKLFRSLSRKFIGIINNKTCCVLSKRNVKIKEGRKLNVHPE